MKSPASLRQLVIDRVTPVLIKTTQAVRSPKVKPDKTVKAFHDFIEGSANVNTDYRKFVVGALAIVLNKPALKDWHNVKGYHPLEVVVFDKKQKDYNGVEGLTYVVVHGSRQYILNDSGVESQFATEGYGPVRYATDDEIRKMVKSFNTAQIKACLSRAEFQPIWEDLLK